MANRLPSFTDASAPRKPGSGEIAEGLVCQVRWARVGKGFWYVKCQQLDCDAFLPVSVLEAAGCRSQWLGTSLVCDIECSGLLFQVVRVHTIH